VVKSDDEFKAALQESQPAVQVAYRWLLSKGYSATVPPTVERPDFETRMSYQDKGDIILHKDGKDLRVEVKGRDLHFTSAEDFPYPTIFIDEDYKVDDPKKPIETLSAYIILNADLTYAAIIRAATRDRWTLEEHWDPTNQDYRTNYVIARRYAVYVKMPT